MYIFMLNFESPPGPQYQIEGQGLGFYNLESDLFEDSYAVI